MMLAIAILSLIAFVIMCIILLVGDHDACAAALVANIFFLPILILSSWELNWIVGVITIPCGLLILMISIKYSDLK